VCVCVRVCVCIFGAVMFCISGFMDDVIFAHKPRLLDVAAQLKRKRHAALGLAIDCAH